MRSRKEIIADGTRVDIKSLEVLLDIRELLGLKESIQLESKQALLPATERSGGKKRRVGRPKKVK